MKFRFISFILFLITATPTFARPGLNSTDSIADNVFTLIYQHKLQSAEQQLDAEKQQLDDFYFLLLNLDLHWWKYRTNDTKENDEKLDQLLSKLDVDNAKTDWQKMQQLLVQSYRLRYEKTKLNFIGMLRTRSKMKELTDEIKLDALPVKGTQHKLFESYVIMFQYIEDINFLNSQSNSGNRKELLTRMETFASDNDIMLNTIARFFLARMYQKVEKEPQTGLSYYKTLTATFPTNTTFAKYKKECEEKL